MKTHFFSLVLFLQLFVACTKNDDNSISSICEDNLPASTTSGANTFGCCINGNLLIPRDGTGTFGGNDSGAGLYGGYPNSTDYYELDIRDFKSERTAKILIHMHQIHTNGIGEYVINESNGLNSIDGLNQNYLHCRVFNSVTNSYQYYCSFENSGILKITRYDFINRTLSGTFNCKVKNSSNLNDVIEIKSGRFDINWQTLPNISFP
jgi:hypothetical protein